MAACTGSDVAVTPLSPDLQAIRELIQTHIGYNLSDAVPPPPRIAAYGEVTLSQQGTLLSQLGNLVDGIGIYSETPKPMEEYSQW